MNDFGGRKGGDEKVRKGRGTMSEGNMEKGEKILRLRDDNIISLPGKISLRALRRRIILRAQGRRTGRGGG